MWGGVDPGPTLSLKLASHCCVTDDPSRKVLSTAWVCVTYIIGPGSGSAMWFWLGSSCMVVDKILARAVVSPAGLAMTGFQDDLSLVHVCCNTDF